MKWVCVAVLIADLLLLAVSGFRYLTAPPKDVAAMSARIDNIVQGRQGTTHPHGEESPRPAAPSGESSAPQAGTPDATGYATDREPAMRTNVLGSKRQGEKLRAIEDARNLEKAEGEKALAK